MTGVPPPGEKEGWSRKKEKNEGEKRTDFRAPKLLSGLQRR